MLNPPVRLPLTPCCPLSNRRNNNCDTPLQTFATTWAGSGIGFELVRGWGTGFLALTVRVATGFVLIIELIMCVCESLNPCSTVCV